MNLHAYVAPIIAAVNPWVTGQYKASTGSTTAGDGTRTPSYATPVATQIQMQALTYKDLQQLDGINLNGESRAMYMNGDIQGVDRPAAKGGDIITLPDDSIWLVVHVLENWDTTSGWSKVAVVKQND